MNNFKSYFSLLKVERDVLVKRARIPFYWPFNLLLLLMNKALCSQRSSGLAEREGLEGAGLVFRPQASGVRAACGLMRAGGWPGRRRRTSARGAGASRHQSERTTRLSPAPSVWLAGRCVWP